MSRPTFPYVGSSYLVLELDGKLLLLKRKNTGFEDGNWGLVSGHIDGNETARQAMVREALEESGLYLSVDDLELVHVMHRKGARDERIDFFFRSSRWSGHPVNKEPDKCEELKWFTKDELPENTINYIRQALECIMRGQKYSEFGWDK
jgi:8-oxo-dGTP diphosphatase